MTRCTIKPMIINYRGVVQKKVFHQKKKKYVIGVIKQVLMLDLVIIHTFKSDLDSVN